MTILENEGFPQGALTFVQYHFSFKAIGKLLERRN